jgi:hypothetical protein
MPIANFKQAIPSTFFYSDGVKALRLYGNAVTVQPGQQTNENSYGSLVD